MILQDLMKVMEQIAPKELAEEWDNVGLLFGDPAMPLTTVVVTLDITPACIAYAKEVGAQAIVTHHPLIFSPVRSIQAPSTLYMLCMSGMAAFAAHTNLDAAQGGVNDVLAAAIGLSEVEPAFGGIGRTGVLPQAMSPRAFASLVSKAVGGAVQLREGSTEVRTVALVGGAAGDCLNEAQADAFLTGELKHNKWLETPPTLTVVAAGHYATENLVVKPLADRLQQALPTVRVEAFEDTAPYDTVL